MLILLLFNDMVITDRLYTVNIGNFFTKFLFFFFVKNMTKIIRFCKKLLEISPRVLNKGSTYLPT